VLRPRPSTRSQWSVPHARSPTSTGTSWDPSSDTVAFSRLGGRRHEGGTTDPPRSGRQGPPISTRPSSSCTALVARQRHSSRCPHRPRSARHDRCAEPLQSGFVGTARRPTMRLGGCGTRRALAPTPAREDLPGPFGLPRRRRRAAAHDLAEPFVSNDREPWPPPSPGVAAGPRPHAPVTAGGSVRGRCSGERLRPQPLRRATTGFTGSTDPRAWDCRGGEHRESHYTHARCGI